MIIIVCLPSLPLSPFYSRELSKPLGMSWKWSDFEGSKKEAESNALVCEKGTVIETSASYMLTMSNTVFTHSYNGLPRMNACIPSAISLIELLHRQHTNVFLYLIKNWELWICNSPQGDVKKYLIKVMANKAFEINQFIQINICDW